MRVLITGGAGFIGSAVTRLLLSNGAADVAVFDAMTYAASPRTLAPLAANPRLVFYERDIRDPLAAAAAFREFEPDVVMHLAAESHVDRSIDHPASFVQTNVVGTQVLLDTALNYWRQLNSGRRNSFRFHHISTDEVFGSLGDTSAFNEQSPYQPRSPYSASKAAADHLVRAWQHTYGLPVLITNCSNNYGPYQFPEKLIPLLILRGLSGRQMPVYGDGKHVRDWLFVEDHAEALWKVVTCGAIGETYAIGARCERQNIDVAAAIADLLDEMAPSSAPHARLIELVADRPGHDRRYAIDCAKIERELGWRPRTPFAEGLRRTVAWYLSNSEWWEPIVNGTYRLGRLGTAVA